VAKATVIGTFLALS